MDIGYAINYIFEDRKWIQKLVILGVLVFLSPLAIIILGLPALIAAFGYMIGIARNVRNGLPRPLPAWERFDTLFMDGGHVLLAMVIYNLPLLLINGFIWLMAAAIVSGVIGIGTNFFTLCCTLPLSILYFSVVWPLLATGVSEYIETNQSRSLYRIVHLWDVMRANGRVVTQWAMYAVMVNIIIIILGIIPCIGWILLALFGIPVHGHLFGQFAHQLSLTNHPKPKPKKKSPKRT